jgi:hypothetical protein
VERRKTSIAVEDRFKVVPFEEFCEIAHIGHSRGYEFLNSGDVKSVLVGRRRLVFIQTGTIISSGCSRNSGLSRPADIRRAGSHHHLSPPIHRPPKHRHRRDAEAARVNIRARLILTIRHPRLPISAGPMHGAASPSRPWSRSLCCKSLRHERRRRQTIPPSRARPRAGKKIEG